MRCPSCGRFSKVHIHEQDGGVETVSVCSYCGEINLSSEKPIEKAGISFDYLKIILVITVIIFAGASVVIYFRYDEGLDVIAGLEENLLSFDAQYSELADNYVVLLNNSEILQGYYNNTQSNYNELKIMYQELRREYSDLQSFHSGSLQEASELLDQISQLNFEKEAIQKELDDILSFSKSKIIEDNSSYIIPPGGNMTISHDIIYAGYIEVIFTSTTDIFLWIGSPVFEGAYYSRFPVFPHTVFNGTFIVPVSHAVFLFIVNTDLELSSEIVMTIKYTY